MNEVLYNLIITERRLSEIIYIFCLILIISSTLKNKKQKTEKGPELFIFSDG